MEEFKPENILKTEIVSPETIKSLPEKYIEKKAVLGIDIYKYSQYPEIEQIYIPVVFEHLYRVTVRNVKEREKYLFSDYGENLSEYKKKFISTGDGGFQIFENVMQAIAFSLYFQTNVKRYVSGGSTANTGKNLHSIVDTIDLRFAITFDKVYSYQSNYFGPAIINNARILSRDSLNRLLIDSNSIKWLTENINTPENLVDIDRETLAKTIFFKKYDKTAESFLFSSKGKVSTVEIQKVGNITAKATKLDIFNMYIQAKLNLAVDHHAYNVYIVTLGNLNSSGIEN